MLFAALIMFVLAVCVTGMICLGAAITYEGFRGRLIDAHCHCGRCGYDLTGHRDRTARCPECGSNLGLPGMMRRSIRRPQKRLITLGLALVIFNVGGLAGSWKLGEIRSASASLTPAPSLVTVNWNDFAAPPTDQSTVFDPGPDDETVFEASSAESRDSTHQSTGIELLFFDATIQLPPLRRESSRPTTSAMWEIDRRAWSSITGVRPPRLRKLTPAFSNNALHFEPGLLRSPLRPIDLSGSRLEALMEAPSMNSTRFNSSPPVGDRRSKLGRKFRDP